MQTVILILCQPIRPTSDDGDQLFWTLSTKMPKVEIRLAIWVLTICYAFLVLSAECT